MVLIYLVNVHFSSAILGCAHKNFHTNRKTKTNAICGSKMTVSQQQYSRTQNEFVKPNKIILKLKTSTQDTK